MESFRAKSSENKSKNCKNHIFHVFFSFCGYLLWAPAPQKQGGNVRYSPKTTWSYSILLCMKTVLQWFRGQSGTWWPRNQTLKNVRGGRAPSSWLVPGSIPWTPKNARERSQERQFSFSALALLTTPQKHLRIASYKLWSHSGSNQARTSRKTAKITFFDVFSLAQASLLVFDQKFKYRGSPPTYAQILLTAPQQHLRLTS